MVKIQRCEYCVHDKICAFKAEYVKACEAINNCSYSTGKVDDTCGFMRVRDSALNVNVRCPYMMVESALRGVGEAAREDDQYQKGD